jgi:2-keto-4-pentenoate hydratase/2-oxohepta-3-ene-1,7-dioic acid hydratase in catechol pathway
LVAAEIAEHPFGTPTFTGRRWPLADTRLLAPILPTKIVCVGKNYADHAKEMGGEAPAHPVIFMKPSTTIVGPGAAIKLPRDSERVDFEGELAVVIGMPCRDVPAARAKDVILGYTIANDVTVRDFIGNFYRPPVKAKGWDTFCPIGPVIVEGEIGDPHRLGLRAFVNGELRQKGTTADLAMSIWDLIAFVSEFMTLEADDVILTGTPEGISHVYPGDRMRIEVDGLGALENPVIAEGTA